MVRINNKSAKRPSGPQSKRRLTTAFCFSLAQNNFYFQKIALSGHQERGTGNLPMRLVVASPPAFY
jgi:hypothetical protein